MTSEFRVHGFDLENIKQLVYKLQKPCAIWPNLLLNVDLGFQLVNLNSSCTQHSNL